MAIFSAAGIRDPMTLSQTDKLICREIVREMMASPEIKLTLEHIAEESAKTVCAAHELVCPVAVRIDRVKWFSLGVFALGGIAGLAFAPAAIKLLLVLLA